MSSNLSSALPCGETDGHSTGSSEASDQHVTETELERYQARIKHDVAIDIKCVSLGPDCLELTATP
jgi:hypothetical protein